MPSFTILDVGHGNSGVLSDDDGVLIIDCGNRQTLLQYIKSSNIASIDAILISHADADHIGGALELLLCPDLTVKAVYINGDSTKATDAWYDFLTALKDAMKRDEVHLYHLDTETSNRLDRQNIQLQVLAPDAVTNRFGVGGRRGRDGDQITSNSMSAVIRIVANSVPKVLAAGDMDNNALTELIASGADLRAQVLVFPHHGGFGDPSDPVRFARELTNAVHPELIAFSIDRSKYGNPKPETIVGVKVGAPAAHIACTQLSSRCAAVLPVAEPTHLSSCFAHGRPGNRCCAGSIEIDLDTAELVTIPARPRHLTFIQAAAPTALCSNLHG